MIREMVNITVKNYCVWYGKDFQETWHNLYHRFLRTFHINLKVRAKNRRISKIDYAEKNGFIGMLLGLALIMFAGF